MFRVLVGVMRLFLNRIASVEIEIDRRGKPVSKLKPTAPTVDSKIGQTFSAPGLRYGELDPLINVY